MASEAQGIFRGIHGIRDMALMLSLGNAYLCEPVFLKKIGASIDAHLQGLKNDISSLKKQFPGQFLREVDADQVLKEIQGTAQRLKSPDKELARQCSAGDLGLQLEEGVDALIEVVDAIRSRVEGEIEGYTKKEAILNQVARIKALGRQIGLFFRLVVKFSGVLALAGAMVFAYLFFTMESEEELLKVLNQSKKHIQAQLKLIAELQAERTQVYKQIEALNEKELSREDKVSLINLNMQVHKLDDRVHNAEGQIDIHERKIKEMERRVEALRSKTFLQRILRR